jgi:hypothetical protein
MHGEKSITEQAGNTWIKYMRMALPQAIVHMHVPCTHACNTEAIKLELRRPQRSSCAKFR